MRTLVRNVLRELRSRGWRLRARVSGVPFDEAYYLASYDDVSDAIERGHVVSAFEHYVRYGRSEGRRGTRARGELDPYLLKSPTTASVFLELTTRCNLRCVYCPVSQPTYRGMDLDLERLDFGALFDQLRDRAALVVSMNGHGESTIVKGWESYSERLASAGVRLHMTTNFAKRLTPPEVSVLSKYEMILISIDSADPVLFGQLRRGGNLQTIYDNIAAVQNAAREAGLEPEIAVSCTVSDVAAPGVAELVDALLERGITKFRFGDLVEYEEIPGAMRTRHVSHLPPAELAIARERFRAALGRIRAAGATPQVDASLSAVLLEDATPTHPDARDMKTGAKTVHYDEVKSKQTRECLDPWRIAFIQADASVRPCCFFEETLGSLETATLGEIVEGEEFRKLRAELLTGNLRPNCANCNSRPVIDVDAFEAMVGRHLHGERERRAGLGLDGDDKAPRR